MTLREQIKSELGVYEDDTAYLNSFPNMMESIKLGISTPLPECISISDVWPDV